MTKTYCDRCGEETLDKDKPPFTELESGGIIVDKIRYERHDGTEWVKADVCLGCAIAVMTAHQAREEGVK